MHSYKDCICLNFLHLVFLIVSANGLLERMNGQTCYICWTFLHCVLLNVASNCLSDRMHSHSGCIYLIFSTVYFQMFPHNAYLRGCNVRPISIVHFKKGSQCTWIRAGIVTLVAFVGLLCVVRCCLKLPAWENAKLYWLHLFDFSPVSVFKCVLKLSAREDANSHWLHLFGISPLHYALGNVIIRNQKSPKVKHYYAFIFHRKSFKPFPNDAKFLKCLYKYFFKLLFWTFVFLFAKNMKGWSYKLEIWYVKQSDPAFKKSRK